VPIFKGRLLPPGVQAPALSPAPLMQIGPIMAVLIEIPPALSQQLASQNQPIPPPVTGVALIDTGATLSGVHSPVLAQLGVATVGLANVGTAGGQQQQNVYPIRIVMSQLNLGLDYNQVLGVDLSGTGYIALLGRDVLQRMILVYDGPGSEFSIMF